MTLDAIKTESKNLSASCDELNAGLQDAEKEISVGQIGRTALAERIHALELESRCPPTEIEGQKQSVENDSNIGID